MSCTVTLPMLQPVSSQNSSSSLATINLVTFYFESNLYIRAWYTVYSGHPVYYSHQTTSQNVHLPNIFCKVDLYITITLPFVKGEPLYTDLTVYNWTSLIIKQPPKIWRFSGRLHAKKKNNKKTQGSLLRRGSYTSTFWRRICAMQFLS